MMFRYSESRYNDLLIVMGGIRVGTLFDFRRREHKRGIADEFEGKKSVSHVIDEIDLSEHAMTTPTSKRDLAAMAAFRSFGIPADRRGWRNVTMSSIKMVTQANAPDCYILCLSEKASVKTMLEFEGADSCVELIDANAFFSTLTEVLNEQHHVQFRGLHKVTYREREESWNGVDWGCHAGLIKEPRFQPQHEIRALWEPLTCAAIKPVILCDRRLVGTCRRIAPKADD